MIKKTPSKIMGRNNNKHRLWIGIPIFTPIYNLALFFKIKCMKFLGT